MSAHLINGEFQSDKYPETPRGKVPLSCKDPTAQDLLWEYAQRRRVVDAEFSDDLEAALRIAGYEPKDRNSTGGDVGELAARLRKEAEVMFRTDRFDRSDTVRLLCEAAAALVSLGSGRDAVIEECAKVADEYERNVTAFSHGVQKAAEKAANTIAIRIRALKSPTGEK